VQLPVHLENLLDYELGDSEIGVTFLVGSEIFLFTAGFRSPFGSTQTPVQEYRELSS
jgi:hypothetical protein